MSATKPTAVAKAVTDPEAAPVAPAVVNGDDVPATDSGTSPPRGPKKPMLTAVKAVAAVPSDPDNAVVTATATPSVEGDVTEVAATSAATGVDGQPIAAAAPTTTADPSIPPAPAGLNKPVALPVKKRKRSAEEAKVLHRAVERRRVLKINTCIQNIREELEKIGILARKDKASVLNSVLTFLKEYTAANKPGVLVARATGSGANVGGGGGGGGGSGGDPTDGTDSPAKKVDMDGAAARQAADLANAAADGTVAQKPAPVAAGDDAAPAATVAAVTE